MAFAKNDPNINRIGRKPRSAEDKPTNRELRERALMDLVRKFKPLQTKAIQAAVKIIDNQEANDANKLKASALIISTYKSLLTEVYDLRYDEEVGEEIQQVSAPVFSLKMISGDED